MSPSLFFIDTPSSASSPLSLHAALPISGPAPAAGPQGCLPADGRRPPGGGARTDAAYPGARRRLAGVRSGEHTSELQSPCNLVCRLPLEKKKQKPNTELKLTIPDTQHSI